MYQAFCFPRTLTPALSRRERANRLELSLMHRYILRRLLLMLPTLLGVAVIVFLLMRVIPGDIVEMRFAE